MGGEAQEAWGQSIHLLRVLQYMSGGSGQRRLADAALLGPECEQRVSPRPRQIVPHPD